MDGRTANGSDVNERLDYLIFDVTQFFRLTFAAGLAPATAAVQMSILAPVRGQLHNRAQTIASARARAFACAHACPDVREYARAGTLVRERFSAQDQVRALALATICGYFGASSKR